MEIKGLMVSHIKMNYLMGKKSYIIWMG